MKVLYVTSECVPFIKTGGLADVAGSLPVELNRQGADVRVVLPKYRCIDWYWRERMTHVTDFPVLFGFGSMYCGVETLVDNGVTYYFIDNEEMFSVDSIYGDGMQEGYRFAFFCRAVAEMLRHIDFAPDVLHLNDWQTGLIAAMVRTQYAGDARFGAMRIVFSIHNLRYQGIFDWPLMNARLGFDERLFTPDYLEFYGNLSCMKAGLVFADHINTVSPTYAREIRTAYYGERLDGLLRARGAAVSGILNGIDRTIYDPATDRFLGAHFSVDDMAGKATQKRYLQQEMHLSERPEVPVIAMVSRLTPQKGLDLVERVLTDILRMDVQLALLGDGDRRFVDLLNWAAWRYPGQVGAYIGLNEGLAHRAYAGSDMFLMPSQFEPCGLSQMIALRYGSVPVVRETGGLCDTVRTRTTSIPTRGRASPLPTTTRTRCSSRSSARRGITARTGPCGRAWCAAAWRRTLAGTLRRGSIWRSTGGCAASAAARGMRRAKRRTRRPNRRPRPGAAARRKRARGTVRPPAERPRPGRIDRRRAALCGGEGGAAGSPPYFCLERRRDAWRVCRRSRRSIRCSSTWTGR